MKENENAKINILPAPTWNHLHINEAEYQGVSDAEEIFEGIKKMKIEPTGQDPVVLDFGEDFEGADIRIEAREDANIIFRFLNSGRDTKVRIRSAIAEGIKLNLSLVKLSDHERFYVTSDADCDRGSTLFMTTVSLGNRETYLEGKASLRGEGSSFDTYTSYILNRDEFLDMNYVADQTGKNTGAEIVSAGVLKEKAEKNSRQTINFISGCAGSKGRESEDVLLLNEDVINRSAPLILCTEEDVEGEHGASIGEPEEDTVFYLKSRGLDIEKIHQMLSIAKIETALKRIDHEETRKLVHEYLGIKEDL